jgi:hypothetical protein
VLVPVQLAMCMAYPFPDTVAGWFQLLQDHPLAGLVNLNLLLVVDDVLLVVIALAANPAVEMLALSNQFAAATRRRSVRRPWRPGRPSWPAGRGPPSRLAASSGSSPGSRSGWSC